jgi:hypothetical protein
MINKKEFMTTKPALQKILQGILPKEEKDKSNHENMGKKISPDEYISK